MRYPTPIPNDEASGWSRARVSWVEGKSRLVASHSAAPLRLLHPRLSDRAACVMLSNYGGGMVQGDRVGLALDCGPGARLLVCTQANSRVYRNDRDWPTSQTTDGHVGAGAKVVVLPDPLVLHAGSRFEQRQRWRVDPGGSLLLGEWFQCGRSDSGECFAYGSYRSEVEISQGDERLAWEPFVSEPAADDPRAIGRFGDAKLILTLYAVGDVRELLHRALESGVAAQRELTQVPALGRLPIRPPAATPRSLLRFEDRPLSIFRALARTRGDFNDIFAALKTELCHEAWLGEDATLFPGRQTLSDDRKDA